MIALSDINSDVVETYSYGVFGQPDAASSVGNPYMFTERRYDSETALYYYRARYYSPGTGRFLQTDPIGYYDGLNLYTYCGNNPINWLDPWGLSNSWNWGWWDIVTFYPHAFYEAGAWVAWGSEEWDGSYTGIGYGKKTLGTCVTTQIPGSEVIGAANVMVEVGNVAIETSKRNKRINEID